MVVSTKDKINRLECLRVDTGDFEVDKLLSGYLQVTVGYKEEMMVDVRC
jgi:predicted polyphosphate/ATP-dependent NAD kinase